MPELTVYHLNPHSAFHFGVRGIEQEKTGVSFPSDSLFAALLSAWLERGGDPADIAGLFPRYREDAGAEPAAAPTPPFLLTSLFPRAGNVRFYPALPLRFLLSADKLDALNKTHRLKEVKKIKYLSEALFLKAVAGEKLDDWLPPAGDPAPGSRGLYLQKGALWLNGDEVERLPESFREKAPARGNNLFKALQHANVWKTDKAPRVTVDRISSASEIFHTERLIFSKACGFWFGIAWQSPPEALRQGVEDALDLLADSGLGAERSAGYGSFTLAPEPKESPLPDPRAGGLFVTLSRYHPANGQVRQTLVDGRTAYTLTSVAGWLRSPKAAAQRRRRIWLVKEGSVLRYPTQAGVLGDIVDVRPRYPQPGQEEQEAPSFEHPVWRYGLAFPVGVAALAAREEA